METGSDFFHRTILGQLYREATKSPDNSTQLAAVIVDETYVMGFTMAYNGFTEGWITNEYNLSRPRKYQIIEHAERRAIYKAARYGIATEGKALYCTWAACVDCARAIVEAGLSKLVRHYPPLDDATERWLESTSMGDSILKAGGVDIVDIVGPIPESFPILRGGELFDASR